MKKRFLAALATGLLVVGMGGVAQAVPCSDTSTGVFVDGSSIVLTCENGTGSNDSESAVDGFFGVSDWVKLDKTDEPESGDSGNVDTDLWTGDFTLTDGYFTLYDDIWTDFSSLMVVLKDGGVTDSSVDPPTTVQWSAYLLTSPELAYDWIYGYNDNDKLKNISHLTLYGVPGSNPVPEPATMLLFGTGLAGLAAVARRRKN